MRKPIILILIVAVSVATFVAFSDGTTFTGEQDAQQQVQERPPGQLWDDFLKDNRDFVVQDTATFDIDVTVRTDGRAVRISGQEIMTDGVQWWMQDTEPHLTVDRVRIKRPEFWVREHLVPDREGQLPEGQLIVLEVNGIAVAMTPWAEHEGILKRIHVDVPEGSVGQEVTIIGYYAGSTSERAIELPGKKCKWCGEVEVCGTNPTCPGT